MKKNRMKYFIVFISFFLGIIFATITFYYKNKDVIEIGEKYKLINETVNIIEKNEYFDYKKENYDIYSIKGILGNLNDKYVDYIPFESKQKLYDDYDTYYVNSSPTPLGSGFSVKESEEGYIEIKNIIDDMAFDKLGVKKGDKITSINNIDVKSVGYKTAIYELLGKNGENIIFSVLRNDENIDFSFDRVNIDTSTIKCKKISDKIIYMKIDNFIFMTAGHFSQSLEKFGIDDSYSIIFDVRENSGGEPSAVVQIADYFLEEMNAVTFHYKSQPDEIYSTSTDGKELKCKVVVLANKKSASASEIFTCLFKEYVGATVIGENTFGKGIWQNYYKLSNGDQIKLTVGQYDVGDLPNFHGVGISPDIEIPMDNSLIGTDDDIQLKKAIEILEK